MSIFLKKFETASEYEAYMASEDKVLPNVSICKDERDIHYSPYVPPHDYSQDYFTIVVTTGGNVTWRGTEDNALSYSTDDGATWSSASSNITLPVNEGDKVLWKGVTTPIEDEGIGKFSGDTNVRYSVEGNTMSLLYGDDFKGQTSLEGKDCALNTLFVNNKSLISAENLSLPATTLANYCYGMMFTNCTSLTTAPELPATTLVVNCYSEMFQDCTSLTTAPELPATTLVQSCYYCMFSGCTSLSSIKCLATDISATNCTYGWVKNVAATGTFTKNASMTSWTTGNNGIPTGWTVVDAA